MLIEINADTDVITHAEFVSPDNLLFKVLKFISVIFYSPGILAYWFCILMKKVYPLLNSFWVFAEAESQIWKKMETNIAKKKKKIPSPKNKKNVDWQCQFVLPIFKAFMAYI